MQYLLLLLLPVLLVSGFGVFLARMLAASGRMLDDEWEDEEEE